MYKLLILIAINGLIAQDKEVEIHKKKESNRVFFGCRAPQTFYINSDIHIYGNGNDGIADYKADFVLKNVKGNSGVNIISAIYKSIIQEERAAPYEFTLDFHFKKSIWGIGARFIHYKYYLNKSNYYDVNGYVNETNYSGVSYFDFIQNFEHTDGHNIINIGPEIHTELWKSKNTKHSILLQGFLGGCVSFNKTKTTILFPTGKLVRIDNDYKWVGGGLMAQIDLKFIFFKYFYTEFYTSWSGIAIKKDYTLKSNEHHLYNDHFLQSITLGMGIGMVFPLF